ncbi:hypothetical protein EJ06DRAFT_515527 [Trichodelitschia bisporula]|uniref:GPI ethanolamine phosphate transferase 2 C-terminal domain-containing protein n=1 Tax=Trichodelitschia bisporula TaxID=703511 RepID=A0A6G1HN19_9PEZI|nr:hypothetical protein EJ06DRAFT_515527 [Trichodelitschia bisporula]
MKPTKPTAGPSPPSLTANPVPDSEYQRIAAEYAAAKAAYDRGADVRQRAKDIVYKRHVGRFNRAQSWLLGVFGLVILLHAAGLYLFTSGFLLTRLVLEEKSNCTTPPGVVRFESGEGTPGTVEGGCWYPRKFNRAVVLVVDALRYDFTVPFREMNGEKTPSQFHDALTFLYEAAAEKPQNALLLPFIADPPTTTLQRLKALMTGTLPTFVDAGSNFAGTAIEEDNLIAQLRDAGKRVVQLGDDTWHALFPGAFDPVLSRPYDSFNVWDLHTVDTGVATHLLPLLHPDNGTQWDVLIGHFLGVDHAGHRFGPNHPAMKSKLKQMDTLFRDVVRSIDDDTLLIVLGDHGMDAKGDHGGESDDEVQAALWMYASQPLFGRRPGQALLPPPDAKQGGVAQIDLVPTLALLLGLPVPFNNLGKPIAEAFVGPDGLGTEALARAARITAAQVRRYVGAYEKMQKLEGQMAGELDRLWEGAAGAWNASFGPQGKGGVRLGEANWKALFDAFDAYQTETVDVCRALWARFDVGRMVSGISVLVASIGLLAVYARGVTDHRIGLSPLIVKRGAAGLGAGVAAGAALAAILPISLTHIAPLLGSAGIIAGFTSALYTARSILALPLPRSLTGLASLLLPLLLALSLASNSYTVWEDRTTLFLSSTTGALLLISGLRSATPLSRARGVANAILFTALGRLSSLSRLCREEQLPLCRSTYYSAGSSAPAAWHLALPLLTAILLPSALSAALRRTDSLHHAARWYFAIALRTALLLSAFATYLEALDGALASDSPLASRFAPHADAIKALRVTAAQLALGIALCVGGAVSAFSAPFMDRGSERVDLPDAKGKMAGYMKAIVRGEGNSLGARYLPLVSAVGVAVGVTQKPLGVAAVGVLMVQILALGEGLDAGGLRNSAVGPVGLGLLGGVYFFATGHQNALAAVQWDAAFVALRGVRQPWSGLLLVGNTWGGGVVAALAVPLVALWGAGGKSVDADEGAGKGGVGKRLAKFPQLAGVAQAVATFMLSQSVVVTGAAAWAGWLRRHLMVYRVFGPRFMFGAAGMLVMDIVALLALLVVRWAFLSVGEVYRSVATQVRGCRE